nr:putative membrane protein yuid [Quercus suber]
MVKTRVRRPKRSEDLVAMQIKLHMVTIGSRDRPIWIPFKSGRFSRSETWNVLSSPSYLVLEGAKTHGDQVQSKEMMMNTIKWDVKVRICDKGWEKTIVLGVDTPGSKLTLSSSEVRQRGKSLMGSLFGGLKVNDKKLVYTITRSGHLLVSEVLVAAGISAAIGQLSKPFTSVLLYGKDLDFKAAFQAGGFPSTHSSAVVATATIIALERGLSDSIFGLTVVYAGLIMYDAQGVRREVGNHAKVLNKVLAKIHVNSVHTKDRENMIDSQPGTSLPVSLERLGPLVSEEASSFTSKSTNSPLLLRSDDKMRQNNQAVLSSGSAANVEEGIERTNENLISLKESIGHTEVEVIAGALLGFFNSSLQVAFATYNLTLLSTVEGPKTCSVSLPIKTSLFQLLLRPLMSQMNQALSNKKLPAVLPSSTEVDFQPGLWWETHG